MKNSKCLMSWFHTVAFSKGLYNREKFSLRKIELKGETKENATLRRNMLSVYNRPSKQTESLHLVLFQAYKTNFSILELKLIPSENQEVSNFAANMIIESETHAYSRAPSLGILHQAE